MRLKRRARYATDEDEPFGSPARGKFLQEESSGAVPQWLVSIVIVGLGLLLGIKGGLWSEFARTRERFHSAQGIITSLSPAREVSTGRSRTSLEVDAQYSFAVDGQIFTGAAIGRFGQCRLRRAEERTLRDSFQRGQPVRINFNPVNPADNFVAIPDMDDRQSTSAQIGALIAAGVTAFGLVCVGLLIVRGPVRYHA